MNTEAFTPYQNIKRYEKTFEPIQFDDRVDLVGLFRITKYEAERVFGAGGIVPEGTPVKIAVPDGTNYFEGDLKICDADDPEVDGITYQKVIPVDTQFPYRRKLYQTAVFYGEKVTIVKGNFIAIWRNVFNVGTTNADIEASIGSRIYAADGVNGIVVAAPGFNGVPDPATGKAIGKIIGTDELPVQHADNSQPLAGAIHKEIYVMVNI